MSKRLFTEKQIKILSTNPYVKSVSLKGITYTEEFKQIFIAQHEMGTPPNKIFEDCGFDVEILGKDRVHSSSMRWRSAYHKEGAFGLKDARKGNSGRSLERELMLEEKYARLEAQNSLLKAENELLKKIRFAERGLKSSN
jgi:hypothetical protein